MKDGGFLPRTSWSQACWHRLKELPEPGLLAQAASFAAREGTAKCKGSKFKILGAGRPDNVDNSEGHYWTTEKKTFMYTYKHTCTEKNMILKTNKLTN